MFYMEDISVDQNSETRSRVVTEDWCQIGPLRTDVKGSELVLLQMIQ